MKLLLLASSVAMSAGSQLQLAPRRRHLPHAAFAVSDVSDLTQSLSIETLLPAVGSGGILGYCAGRATRVAGDAASIAVGATFIFLSTLQRGGYITINYVKLERDIRSLLDINKDGKVGCDDCNLATARMIALLADNSAGTLTGVAAGFALGIKG